MIAAIWFPEDSSCARALCVIGDDYKMCLEKAEEAARQACSAEKMMQMIHDIEPEIRSVSPGNPLAILVDVKP